MGHGDAQAKIRKIKRLMWVIRKKITVELMKMLVGALFIISWIPGLDSVSPGMTVRSRWQSTQDDRLSYAAFSNNGISK